MWIPTTFYDKAPQYWLFLGLFLMVVSTYLGFEMQRPYFFAGGFLGIACCLWSAITYYKRAIHRERPAEATRQSTGSE